MGLRRAGVALSALVYLVALLPLVSHGQTSLTDAAERQDQAYQLLGTAQSDRAQVEARLLVALEEYQRITAELAAKSASVDRLGDLVGMTEIELARVSAQLDQRAVDAYMNALTLPAGVVLQSADLAQAMARQPIIELLEGDDSDQTLRLTVNRQSFDLLRVRIASEAAEAASLQVQAERAADELEALFAQADERVALAIADARGADRAYLAALDQVEQAQAAAAAQEVEAARGTTTTTIPGATTPTTSLPPPPSIGERPLKPAVERWRGQVATYFPSEWVEPALRIMQCESLGDPEAYNPYSGASGLFQFLPGTWAVISPKAGFSGASAFEAEANIATAAWLAKYYQGLGRSPWTPWYCTP